MTVAGFLEQEAKKLMVEGEQTSSRRELAFLMAAASLGTGMLTLPFAFREAGIICATAVFIFAGVQSALSNYYIGIISRIYRVESYGALLEAVSKGNKYVPFALDVGVLGDILCAIVSFFIFLTHFLLQLLECLGIHEPVASRSGVRDHLHVGTTIIPEMSALLPNGRQPASSVSVPVATTSEAATSSSMTKECLEQAKSMSSFDLVTNLAGTHCISGTTSPAPLVTKDQLILGIVICILPFALRLKSIASLGSLSNLSVFALTFTFAVVTWKAAMLLLGEGLGSFSEWNELSNFPSNLHAGLHSFALVMFANVNQVCTAPIMKEAGSSPTTSTIWAVAAGGATICGFLYYFISVVIVYKNGPSTNADFLENYSRDDPFMIVSRILLVGTLLVSILLNLFPALQALYRVIAFFRPSFESEPNKVSFTQRLVCVCILLGVAMTLAMTVNDLAGFIGVAGAIFGSLLSAWIPGYIMLASRMRSATVPVDGKNAHLVDAEIMSTSFVGPVVLLSTAVVMWGNTVAQALGF